MSLAYFDTSAFVKLFLEEAGTPVVQDVWMSAAEVASSRLLYPEVRATLAAAYRQKRIAGSFAAVKALAEAQWNQLLVVEVEERLAASAGDLAELEGLRGYDSMHLASALECRADVFVCADQALCKAALRQGLTILNPDNT